MNIIRNSNFVLVIIQAPILSEIGLWGCGVQASEAWGQRV